MAKFFTDETLRIVKLLVGGVLISNALSNSGDIPRLSTTLRYRHKIREQEKIIKTLSETVKDLKYKDFYPKTLEQMVKEGQITPELAEDIREMKRRILHDRHLD